MSPPPPSFRLPPLLKDWPWPRVQHPALEEAAIACISWLDNSALDASDKEKVRRGSELGSTLAALAYPTLDKKSFIVACHLLSVLFLIDDFTDPKKASDAQNVVNTIMDVFEYPLKERSAADPFVAETTRQFWIRALDISPLWQQTLFIAHFREYLNAVVIEASDREIDHLRDFDDYIHMRRSTGALRPAFWVIECAEGLPEHVVKHESIVTLATCAADLIIFGNDILSYNREQALGSLHNTVSIAVHKQCLGIQEAIDWTVARHDDVARKFQATIDEVPSWGPDIDNHVRAYIDTLGYWVRANWEWSLGSSRYFEKEEWRLIEKTGIVELLPKVLEADKI
ncbi:terpenoid synthase [Sistotremastrum suecicum HHB10207 ss-3]|uniref:Terpene synthase n=1 Tax=Sistotremastrum suecicum HHB10207 ss-3 TaxID=1314776 RepID=A0A166A5R7_9AGAM|nr:terpenoid synthase [Sistotremastrum suecicum HHB10207 ss-3]